MAGSSEMILSAHHLAKVGVEGSNPFARSKIFNYISQLTDQPNAAVIAARPGKHGGSKWWRIVPVRGLTSGNDAPARGSSLAPGSAHLDWFKPSDHVGERCKQTQRVQLDLPYVRTTCT